MRFTISKKADTEVKRHLDLLCMEIRNEPVIAKSNLKSIILYGGYGRGEGTVRFVKGKFYPVNDYDVYIVTKKRVKDETLDKVAKRTALKIGKKGITFKTFQREQNISENFYFDLKCLTEEQLKNLFPMMRYYELKNASTILWGEDSKKLIPDFSVEEIPLSEGARLLLNRLTHLVEYYTDKKSSEEILFFFCVKAYLSCCTSLLLLSGDYKPTYVDSYKSFKKVYKKKFPELYEKMPDLVKKIEFATKAKLKFRMKPVKRYWKEARDDSFEVAKYFISKFSERRIASLDDFSKAVNSMSKIYQRPYVEYFLKRRGLNIWPLRKVILRVLPFYFNLLYFIRVWKQKRFYPRILFNAVSPDLIIFSAVGYLLFSVDGDVEKLERAKRILSKVYPVEGKDWKGVSQDFANAYVAFFLQKIV